MYSASASRTPARWRRIVCTERLRHLLPMVTAHAGVTPFSAAFIWDLRHEALRFGAFLTPDGGRVTVLEAVLRADLSDAERQCIFPTALDLGRLEPLRREQRTYQAIAEAVAAQRPSDSVELDERYVKQTAKSVADLAGFPFSSYRERDPDLAARVLKLFVFLKKTYGPGVIGMLQPPGGTQRPSLELSNPYVPGTGDDRRRRYAEVLSYVSVQIPPVRRAAIDAAFGRLRPALGKFLGRVQRHIVNTPLTGTGRFPEPQDARRRLQQAAEIYMRRFAVPEANEARVLLPLDEQLYVYLLSLDFLHYAEFMQQMRNREFLRVKVQPAVKKFRGSRVAATWHGLRAHADEYMPLLKVVAYALGETIEPNQFRRAILRGSDVLRHYLQGRTLDQNATADFRLLTATLCFAMELETGRVSDYKPYVHGQGNISGSVSGAMRDQVNARHEEFERICAESVDWYQAALIDQVELHQTCHDLNRLVEDLVVRACQSHDIHRLETLLETFSEPGFDAVWVDEDIH